MHSCLPLFHRLKETQFSNGSFENSPFQTALILIFLKQFSGTQSLNEVITPALNYLMTQSSLTYSWNYRDRHSYHAPLPDDLDDTALVLTALTLYQPDLVTDDHLIALTHTLISCEQSVGGPYSTWIVPATLRDSWNDCDLVVNSNIYRLLKLHSIDLEPLHHYLAHSSTYSLFISKYYSDLQILFFLSCSSAIENTTPLLEQLELLRPTLITSLDLALFSTTYLQLGGRPHEISSEIHLLKKIHPDTVTADPFCVEEKDGTTITYSGSSSLTLAAIIQAITLYEYHAHPHPQVSDSRDRRRIHKIRNKTLACFDRMHPEIKTVFQELLYRFEHYPTAREIFILPWLWYQSLNPHYRTPHHRQQIELLCVAQVFGWIGYSLIDHCIDTQNHSEHIPLAQLCLRELDHIIFTHSPQTTIRSCKNILRTIDQALYQETSTSHRNLQSLILPIDQLGSYQQALGQSYRKSYGHALGACIITHTFDTELFFKHYLIARQLNDDAHDWLEDLEHGIINPVAVRIFEILKTIHPDRKSIHIHQDRQLLQSIFWYEAIDDIVMDIYEQCTQVRNLVAQYNLFTDTTLLDMLIEPLEKSATLALRERDRITRFLEKYH